MCACVRVWPVKNCIFPQFNRHLLTTLLWIKVRRVHVHNPDVSKIWTFIQNQFPLHPYAISNALKSMALHIHNFKLPQNMVHSIIKYVSFLSIFFCVTLVIPLSCTSFVFFVRLNVLQQPLLVRSIIRFGSTNEFIYYELLDDQQSCAVLMTLKIKKEGANLIWKHTLIFWRKKKWKYYLSWVMIVIWEIINNLCIEV